MTSPIPNPTPTIRMRHDAPDRVEDKTWHGCTEPHGCIMTSSGHDLTIRDVSMFDVSRAVLCYPNAIQNGGVLDGVVIDGLTVRGHLPHDKEGTNYKGYNEALCFHGNGGRRAALGETGFQGWIKNIETRNVHVLDWPHEPLSLYNANFDRFLATEWVSHAEGPVRINLKRATTVNDIRIQGGEWSVPHVEWILIGPHSYHGDDIGRCEFPAGWTHSLHWWSGPVRRDHGTFDSLKDLRAMLTEVGDKWRDNDG